MAQHQDASSHGAKTNVLLIGGGGREHALARALFASPSLGTLYATHSSNPGIAQLAQPCNEPTEVREAYRLVQWCEKHDIGLVVVGPEDPLADGIADKLAAPGRLVFGPTRDGARLEADKAWAKQLMRAAAIPTAESRTFTDPEAALSYVRSRDQAPVVKAAGLAKGKGVVVARDTEEASKAIVAFMIDRIHGDAGRSVVIEEKLEGPEVSVLALVDGRNIMVLPPCRDHKRLGEGDTGPNTGGMGAFCPTADLDDRMLARIEREILVPTVDALTREDIAYRGVLYAGLMLTHAGPKVLEFNVRFGDPECQPLMARFRGDLVRLLKLTAQGHLDRAEFSWDPRHACCVVLASGGYPEKPKTGVPITGIAAAEKIEGVVIDHAGTKRQADGTIVTAGGRVLGVTGLGETLEAARSKAYEACRLIRFDGMQVRSDIGVVREPAPRVFRGTR